MDAVVAEGVAAWKDGVGLMVSRGALGLVVVQQGEVALLADSAWYREGDIVLVRLVLQMALLVEVLEDLAEVVSLHLPGFVSFHRVLLELRN